MSEVITLLASLASPLIRKEAISERKIEFLSGPTRYGPKLYHYVTTHNLVNLMDETLGEEAEQKEAKKQNEQMLNAKYAQILTQIAAADPTDGINKNDFTEWLLKVWLAMDDAARGHWGEDTANIKQSLADFVDLRKSPEWKKQDLPTDLNRFSDLANLRSTLTKFNSASDIYTLPELSPEGATIIYQDKTYILWQVTSAKDLTALSRFPENNPPAWCTNNEGTAANYLSSGPDYVAYKNGDPFFQLDPSEDEHHDKSKAQFMSRNNTHMYGTKLMNPECAELIEKALAHGKMNERAREDLTKTMGCYQVPNLNDAETFSYLQEYVMVNGGNVKKDKKFLDAEEKYVRPRYELLEPDELRELCNRYARTGEAVAPYYEANKNVTEISKKIDNTKSYTDFVKSMSTPDTDPNHLTPAEYGLAFRIDPLFKKVFNLFSKEYDWDEKFAKFRAAVKEGSEKAVNEGEALVNLLNSKFPSSTYSYDRSAGNVTGFTIQLMGGYGAHGMQTKDFTRNMAVQPYIKMIKNMFRPFVNQAWEKAVEQAKAEPEYGVAYRLLRDAGDTYKRRVSGDGGAEERAQAAVRQALKDIEIPAREKLDAALAGFTKLKEVATYGRENFLNGSPFKIRKIPSWAQPSFEKKITEIELLTEKAMEDKLQKVDRGEVKIRTTPKREYEFWKDNHRDKDLPDPTDKVLEWVINSPSFDDNNIMDALIEMKNISAVGEAWILQKARYIGSWRLDKYMEKFHPKRWPELETAYPAILDDDDYVNRVYEKNERIPRQEEAILAGVGRRRGVSSAIAYIKERMNSKPWPELEKAVAKEFKSRKWSESFYDGPGNIAGEILEYIAEIKKSRWKDIEEKMFENQDWGYKYLFQVLGADEASKRIRKLLDEESETLPRGEKQSRLHQVLFAKVISYKESV